MNRDDETLPVVVAPPLSPAASCDAAVAEAYGVDRLDDFARKD